MGTNCTCNERKVEERNRSPSSKNERSKNPMFFEEVSFDIKHSEVYDENDMSNYYHNRGNQSPLEPIAEFPVNEEGNGSKSKAKYHSRCKSSAIYDMQKLLKCNKVSQKELVEFVISEVKENYQKHKKEKDGVAEEGWLKVYSADMRN